MKNDKLLNDSEAAAKSKNVANASRVLKSAMAKIQANKIRAITYQAKFENDLAKSKEVAKARRQLKSVMAESLKLQAAVRAAVANPNLK